MNIQAADFHELKTRPEATIASIIAHHVAIRPESPAIIRSKDDVLTYERRLVGMLERLEAVQKPTIAMIRGFAVGGGSLISSACDLRIATPESKFGIPVARTLGNVISSFGFTRLVALIGPARTKEILFTARLIGAEEGKAIGLFNEIVDADRVIAAVAELVGDDRTGRDVVVLSGDAELEAVEGDELTGERLAAAAEAAG